ncbi:MAG TPA: enoyl-CoA hydratase/isomerase family protein [Geobacteraceae bacterium]
MFQVEKTDRSVVVTFARSPVNALSDDCIAEFHRVLDEIDRAGDVVVLHLRSGLAVFSAGADLKEVEERLSLPPERMVEYNRSLHRLFDRIEALPCVTLCEINGAAFGGGLELALACDLRIAADNANIGLPEARLGLIPGAGGTQRLTRLCGPGVASRLILGCEVVTGATACSLGVVQWAAPAAELAARASELREQIASLALPALRVSKSCIAAYARPELDGFEMEIESQRELIVSAEARSRVTAFVAERRAKAGAQKGGHGKPARGGDHE